MTCSIPTDDPRVSKQLATAQEILAQIRAHHLPRWAGDHRVMLEQILIRGPQTLNHLRINEQEQDDSDFLCMVIEPICDVAELEMERKCVLALVIRLAAEELTVRAVRVFAECQDVSAA